RTLGDTEASGSEIMLRDKNAAVYLHGEVLVLLTCSGPGACVQDDWECPVTKMDISSVTEAEIGRAVRAAWTRCREIPLAEYKVGLAAHMELLGVKTQKKLYANTKEISVLLKNGIISTLATYQHRTGEFRGIGGSEIRLPEVASDEALGQAIKTTLS